VLAYLVRINIDVTSWAGVLSSYKLTIDGNATTLLIEKLHRILAN